MTPFSESSDQPTIVTCPTHTSPTHPPTHSHIQPTTRTYPPSQQAPPPPPPLPAMCKHYITRNVYQNCLKRDKHFVGNQERDSLVEPRCPQSPHIEYRVEVGGECTKCPKKKNSFDAKDGHDQEQFLDKRWFFFPPPRPFKILQSIHIVLGYKRGKLKSEK